MSLGTISPEETPPVSFLEDKGLASGTLGVKWAERTRHLRILLSVKYPLINNCPASASTSPVVLSLPSNKPLVFYWNEEGQSSTCIERMHYVSLIPDILEDFVK